METPNNILERIEKRCRPTVIKAHQDNEFFNIFTDNGWGTISVQKDGKSLNLHMNGVSEDAVLTFLRAILVID